LPPSASPSPRRRWHRPRAARCWRWRRQGSAGSSRRARPA